MFERTNPKPTQVILGAGVDFPRIDKDHVDIRLAGEGLKPPRCTERIPAGFGVNVALKYEKDGLHEVCAQVWCLKRLK